MDSITPAIAVIVPLLDEAAELPALFFTLSQQIECRFELILCDGGSRDGSQQIISALTASCGFPVTMLHTERGRGRQMNAGAAVARGQLLLFLHADTRFDDRRALGNAIGYLQNQAATTAQLVAARFRLSFRRSDSTPSLSYFFYRSKARLPRVECIRGDQGLLLSRSLFDLVNGFDESLPFLEDVRLAATVAGHTDWLLLPVTISTSARRFEREGLLQRQTLNAIIVNNALIGWSDFFTALPGLYRLHAVSGKLQLVPVLAAIRTLLRQQKPHWRRFFWQSTGRHIAANAWQLFFWLDVRRAFRYGDTVDVNNRRWLTFYEMKLGPFFSSRYAALAAQLLTRLWLWWMLLTKTSRTA